MEDSNRQQWEQRFRDTAELLPGIICEIDRNLRITYVNRLAFESFKYEESELENGLNVKDLLHPDDKLRGMKNIQRVLDGKWVGPQEYRLVHRDGAAVYYQVNSSAMTKNDRVVGVRTCLFDLSDRKRAERALRSSEERFRQIFSRSPIGVVLCDAAGRPMNVNAAFRDLFGMSKDDSVEELPLLFDLAAADPECKKLLADGDTVRQDGTLHRPSTDRSEEQRYLEWHITPVCADDEQQYMILAQVNDVTERRLAAEAKLKEAQQAAEKAKQLAESLRQEVRLACSFRNMVSRSPRMRKIFDILPQVAETTTTALITGESGTGKELIARAIHELGPRKDKPIVAINCSALPDTLLESELFGYKAGAFTDAKKDKQGKFAAAEGGTLFLDEVGDISPAMQVKLLRVLQERTYEPLGAISSIQADVRVVAATNRDLVALVAQGAFREDLFYRINVIEIRLPPLRERRSDIPLLIDHFVDLFNQRYGRSISGISQEALNQLVAHNFPGNIRELENIIERAFVFCKEGKIEPFHLPEELIGSGTAVPTRLLANFGSLEALEAHYLRAVLEETDGNKLEAARRLGIHKSTLFRRLKKLGVT